MPSPTPPSRLHARVHGLVQGVFFRDTTRQRARALGLTGWVRNLRSGDVEIHVCGPEDKVEELIRRCWEGPHAAQVADVQVEDIEPEPFQGFSARATQ